MNYTMEEKYELIKKNIKNQDSKNPIEIVRNIMDRDFINIHGPEHHLLDGAAFMKALHNAGLEFDFDAALDLLAERSIKMPGAMCGFWGMCGSVASVGAVLAILDETGPLSNDEHYKEHMKFTSSVIERMSEIGGPRCCKRNAFLSISAGSQYAKEYFGIELDMPKDLKCEYSSLNSQCIKARCPYHN